MEIFCVISASMLSLQKSVKKLYPLFPLTTLSLFNVFIVIKSGVSDSFLFLFLCLGIQDAALNNKKHKSDKVGERTMESTFPPALHIETYSKEK